MATTTNYSWATPDDTDLVKDGAAAIRTLGSSADTTVKNLNPGTTAGDIDYYTSGTAKARVAIGTAGQVLQVNSGATAPEWVTPSSGSLKKIATVTFSSVSSVSFANDTFTSTYKDYLVLVDITGCSTGAAITGRLRAAGSDNTTSNYFNIVQALGINGTQYNDVLGAASSFKLGYESTANRFSTALTFLSPKETAKTKILGNASGINSDQNNVVGANCTFIFDATTSFDSFSIILASGTFSGRYAVYGMEA
jgi:hypothetical protein